MVEIGKTNALEVVKKVDFGVYLDGDEFGEILLPLRYVPAECNIGEFLNVFIYTDSEDRIIATTETPLAQVGDFAYLQVKDTSSVGAFLDWKLMKDLLVPFSEQKADLNIGNKVFVYVYLDEKTKRIVASAKWEKFIEKDIVDLSEGTEVSLKIAAETELGYKAVIDGKFMGLLYKDEVFRSIQIGDTVIGFIKHIRPDAKIDLSLTIGGYGKVKNETERILEKLRESGGFLPTTDKSSAELIYQTYGISKKTYKQAIGDLYKRCCVLLEQDGIRLNNTKQKNIKNNL